MKSLLQLLSELEATEMARIVGGTLSSFSDVTITGSYTTTSYKLLPVDPCRSSSTLFV
jgi:hypothetical protein